MIAKGFMVVVTDTGGKRKGIHRGPVILGKQGPHVVVGNPAATTFLQTEHAIFQFATNHLGTQHSKVLGIHR